MKTFNFEKWLKESGEDYPFYNGGWSKKVTGVDKTKQNGYSILGEFINKEGDFIFEDGIYLLCDKQGSRGNQKWNYYLIKLIAQKPTLLFSVKNGGRDWALKFWDSIERNVITEEERIKSKVQEIVKEFSKEKIMEVLKKI